jgi:CRP-like cAMP-binding protein
VAQTLLTPLASVPIFRELSADALAHLSALVVTAHYPAGATIFLAREPGDALYVMTSGRVRIWVQDADGDVVTLAELGPGDFFGEMAVIDGGTRSASATAIDDCTLGCLRRRSFEAFLVGHPPAALDVMRGLGARLRQTNTLVAERSTRNANELYDRSLSRIDRVAVAVTDKVGSFGFFLIILFWTVAWTSYNMLASLVPALGWMTFDPFPAFVAYLLMSNVIQILLMPLILVGQNLQSRHTETRAELDFQTNVRAEKEIQTALLHLQRNTAMLQRLMRHVGCSFTTEEAEAAEAERGRPADAPGSRSGPSS